MSNLYLRVACIVILCMACAMEATAGMRADLETELQLIKEGKVTQRIPGAKYRVAVFAYEDPDGTGLGTDLAALIANHVLLASQVRSLGVIHYRGKLSPSKAGDLSYFNKVDRVIEAQEVSLAVWGMVRSVGANLVIDTYLQIPEKVSGELLVWKFLLPLRMGGGALVAHLRPDRIHVQRLVVPLEFRALLTQAAQRILELREEPTLDSQVSSSLPLDQVYWVVDRNNDWARFETKLGQKGWVPITAHCPQPCRPLLDAAAFTGELLAYLSGKDKERVPRARSGLTADTLAIEGQIRALDLVAGARQASDISDLTNHMVDWVGPNRKSGPDKRTQIERGSGTPPGGAAFANILAIAGVMGEVHRAYGERVKQSSSRVQVDDLVVPKEKLSDIAFDLAEASLYDPQNLDVLQNLTVLFGLAGDSGRSALAGDLVQQAEASLRQADASLRQADANLP